MLITTQPCFLAWAINSEQRDGRLIMYGGQEGRGWTFVVTSATGRMSASVVDDGFSFVIFGTCAEHKP